MSLKSLLIGCTLILLSLINIGCGEDTTPSKAPIKTVKSLVVQAQTTTIRRRFPGKVLASQRATLSFKVAGQIIELPIREGLMVQKGTLIARLDPQKFQDRVDETKAIYIRNEAEFKRAASLVDEGHISRTEYDAKRSAFLVARANLSSAREDLKDTQLKASFTGVISKKFVENFEYVKARQAVVNLHDISSIDIEIYVPENIIITLKEGQEGKQPIAIFDSLANRQFTLNFKEVSTQADPDTQTYRVVMTMPAPKDVNLLPGMTATVQVDLPAKQTTTGSGINIPSSAVFVDDSNQPAVWVVDEKTMRVKKTPIKVNRLGGDRIQVLSGLKPGDRIVTAGVHFLQPNEQVRLATPMQGDQP